ncbi:MAG: MFS transporter [Rhodanobacteraceae bacterium]|nr:MAG: MFS transporter [Rhodanobacteraceae bacterium]
MRQAIPIDVPPARVSIFANREFRLLFGGSSVSAIGDQFTLVALPWLVLKLTGDPAALGAVLAVMAFPRAVFMLVGGAVVDRMSPRRVLLGARAVNAACIVILAALVLDGGIHMWMIYVLALGIGVSTAFAYPAGSAILPQLVQPGQLRPANAAFMGMRQLSLIVGPTLAGFVIAIGAHHPAAGALPDAEGLGLAFSIDAVSFLFSLASLVLIRIPGDTQPAATRGGIFASIATGVRSVWADVPLRAFVLYAGFVSVFVGGPVQVGLPVLADTRLNLGAASLGILMTANGAGMFIGSFLSGLGTRLARGRLGIMVLCFDCLVGAVFAGLALVHTTRDGALLLLGVGLLEGIVQIAIFTWIQQRVPQAMMGRTMSILMFTFMGLGPLSAAAAGALLKVVSLAGLFAAAGLTLTLIALLCLASPQLRSIRTAEPRPAGSPGQSGSL